MKASTISIIITLLGITLLNFHWKPWERRDGVLHWDINSYYGYLPLTFIYKDVKAEKLSTYPAHIERKIWLNHADGHQLIKTTCGTAIMYSPFFALGALTAKITGHPVDGYSEPFIYWLQFSSFFYLTLATILLIRFLKHFYSDLSSGVTALLTVLATNVVQYTTNDACMSHVFTLFLITAFLNLTYAYRTRRPDYKVVIGLGIVSGLIILIRPTNILIWIIFFLYGVNSIQTFRQRIIDTIKAYTHLLAFAALTLIVWVPQFTYWKIVTGSYLFFSYGEEKFYFNDPELISGLFGFRKGWLLYTPVMAFALIGLFLIRKDNPLKLSAILFMLISTYVILSWWCWWYGGGFSNRAFIDTYPVLAIGLAACIQEILKQRLYIKIPALIVGIYLCYLNIFQHFQYDNSAIHYDSMTKSAYFESFGKLYPTKNYWFQLEPIDYDRALAGEN